MNVLNFEAHRRKRLRELLSSAFRGQLPPQNEELSEIEAWKKEMEKRRLGAQKRYEHDPAFKQRST